LQRFFVIYRLRNFINMNLQFILDSTGKATGVYIPIQEWNELKEKYKGIAEEENVVPSWHKDLVRERITGSNSTDFIAFDEAMNDIENDL
jgi:hypothetical protein